MMSKNADLIGRIEEHKVLHDLNKGRGSEFVAIYGRRRIGKTYLIQQCFRDHPFYFEFVGTHKGSLKTQLKNFAEELSRVFKIRIKDKPETWTDAFQLLTQVLENHKRDSSFKKVIFFDELPWLAARKSGFLEALDYFWNSYATKRKDIVLVICGSAASWMISKVINSKGGLHNRITKSIALSRFSLKETKEYLREKHGIELSDELIAEIYMATGGVAYYLDQVKRGESATQFINRSFFSLNGELRKEFDRLFVSIFDDHQKHVEVIRLLAKNRAGLSTSQMLEKLKKEKGGGFSEVLEELEKSEFIQFIPRLEKKRRDGVFRIIDEYTLFYLAWVESLGRMFRDETYWEKQVGTPRYNAWLGYAFENLCLSHAKQITNALGVSGLATQVLSFQNKKVQIDMIIDRPDKAINLCEMKYTFSPFVMSQSEMQKIRARKRELLANLKRKKHIFVTLVTPFPSKRNKHYIGTIDNEINLVGFF
ncbi:ATP-binding protein [Bdellovibrionota bacterium FG-2]